MFQGQKPQSIFEIGCANGGLLKDLVNHYGDIPVGGVDVSVSIQKAKELFPKYSMNFLRGDLNDPWPIPDNSYDIVFSVGVLMYMFEPLHVLREMYRITKHRIILAEYHNEQVDFCGALTKAFIKDNRVQVGLIRDYKTLFAVLNLPFSSISYEYDQETGKTIFICTK